MDLADLYVKWGKVEEADGSFRDAIHTVETARSEISQEEKRMSFLDAGPFYDGYLSFLIDHGKEIQAMRVAEFGRARTLAEGMGIDPPKSRLTVNKPLLTPAAEFVSGPAIRTPGLLVES